jgi:CRP/FNR family transcriptional regulator
MNGKRLWPEREAFDKGIFSAMPEEDWRNSTGFGPPVIFEKKRILFRENDPASSVYIVGSGLMKTFKSPSGNRVQIVCILGPGDVLGTEALSRDKYSGSAASLTRSMLFRFDKSDFLDFISRRPTLSVKLIDLLIRSNTSLQTLLCDLGTKKALPRVASCLLLFMDKQVPAGEVHPFNLPISRQEMGAFLGLSPETVSRQLKDLTTSRVIKLDHRRLTVLDLKNLRSIAQT